MEGRYYAFVGERPSNTARRMKVTWEDGRLAAKPLHEALSLVGLDPKSQVYLNIFHTAGPLRVNKNAVRTVKSLIASGVVIVALGQKVGAALDRLGIEHVKMVHPAARGAIRKSERYRQHVKERLLHHGKSKAEESLLVLP